MLKFAWQNKYFMTMIAFQVTTTKSFATRHTVLMTSRSLTRCDSSSTTTRASSRTFTAAHTFASSLQCLEINTERPSLAPVRMTSSLLLVSIQKLNIYEWLWCKPLALVVGQRGNIFCNTEDCFQVNHVWYCDSRSKIKAVWLWGRIVYSRYRVDPYSLQTT